MVDSPTNPAVFHPSKSLRSLLLAAVAVAAAAGAYAGVNAWREQQHRTLPLDLDGWGHLVRRLSENGRDFGSLFVEPSLWKGPVVPFMFGLSYYVWPIPESVLIFNALAFGAGAGLLFFCFCRLGAGPWPAAAGVLLGAFYWPHHFVFGYYYAEPLLVLLISIVFLLSAASVIRRSVGLLMLSGAAGGILLLARAPFFPVVCALPLLLVGRMPGKRVAGLGLYAAGLTLGFAPWGVRNYFAVGEFIPFTLEGGVVLFQATHLPGDDVGFDHVRNLPEYREREAMPPVERYHAWQRAAMAQVREDLPGQLRLCARKAIRFWMYLPAHSWVPSWKTATVAAVCLPLAAIGFWFHRRRLLVQLCALWVCGLWAFHALLHSELRYNFPVLPMVFFLAVVGGSQCLRRPWVWSSPQGV